MLPVQEALRDLLCGHVELAGRRHTWMVVAATW